MMDEAGMRQLINEDLGWLKHAELCQVYKFIHRNIIANTPYKELETEIANLAYQAGVMAEREECAKVCDPKNPPHDWTELAKVAARCAAAIRKRTGE